LRVSRYDRMYGDDDASFRMIDHRDYVERPGEHPEELNEESESDEEDEEEEEEEEDEVLHMHDHGEEEDMEDEV
jgi:hypothetical protein